MQEIYINFDSVLIHESNNKKCKDQYQSQLGENVHQNVR